MKPWRLTRRAEDSLVEIFSWTLSRFGERQAIAYRDALIEFFHQATDIPRHLQALAG